MKGVWPSVGIVMGCLLLFLSQESVSLPSRNCPKGMFCSPTPISFYLFLAGAGLLAYSVFIIGLSLRKAKTTQTGTEASTT
jgi:hypothetical protein